MRLFNRQTLQIWSSRVPPIILVTGVVLLSSCAVFRHPPAISPEIRSPKQVLATLESNYARLDYFKGRGRLSVTAPDRAVSLDVQVYIDRPDTLYIRLEAIFGIDVGWLYSDGREYRYYIPMQNIYGQGSIDSLRKERLVALMVDYDELLALFSGIERAKDLNEPKLSHEGKTVVLTGEDAMGKHTYWIDAKHGVVTQSQVSDSLGRILLQQKYERFRRIRNVLVPHVIRLERPAEKQVLILFYDQISINRKFSANEIKTKIPASARKMTKWRL